MEAFVVVANGVQHAARCVGVDVVRNAHNLLERPRRGPVELELHVDAAGAQNRLVERVDAVRRHKNEHLVRLKQAVHHVENVAQRQRWLLVLGVLVAVALPRRALVDGLDGAVQVVRRDGGFGGGVGTLVLGRRRRRVGLDHAAHLVKLLKDKDAVLGLDRLEADAGVVQNLHQRLARLDALERHLLDVAARVVGDRLDDARLAAAGRAVEEHRQRVGLAAVGVPLALRGKVGHAAHNRLGVLGNDVLRPLRRPPLVAFVVGCRVLLVV